jgi:cytochrome c
MTGKYKPILFLVLLAVISTGRTQEAEKYGIGRIVSQQEIDAWDIDIKPDGSGLPAGQGSVAEGETIYRSQCQACHGRAGQNGRNTQLVSAYDPGVNFSLGRDRKTIGSYWPYATTLYDYIRRAMPFTAPGSLSDGQVYALTAYLLYLNGLVEKSAVMNSETLPGVTMPAKEKFYWSQESQ